VGTETNETSLIDEEVVDTMTKLMKAFILAAVLMMLALTTVSQDAWAGLRPSMDGDAVVECISVRQLGPADDYPDMWEYVYDVIGTADEFGVNHAWTRYVDLEGFDGTQVVNQFYMQSDRWDGVFLPQNWDSHCYQGDPFWSGWQDRTRHPSYWDFGTWQWILPNPGDPNWEWRYLNEWHGALEYIAVRFYYPGVPDENGVHWESYRTPSGNTGLFMTFRIVHPAAPGAVEWSTYNNYITGDDDRVYGLITGPGGAQLPTYLEGVELFYNGKFGNAPDLRKQFMSPGQASHMSITHDDLFGNVSNYVNGITGIRLKFAGLVTFSGAVADAFSFEATPEQSSDSTFSPLVPPTAPTFVQDDSSGKTEVTITFVNGEIKNRWLKTLFDGDQIAELEDAAFIIGNRVGDIDTNYRCLLNDAISIRSQVSGALVGISNVFDIDKNERILLNEAIIARNAVSGIALPTLP